MNMLATWLDRKSLYLALLAAWVAMLGSLYFSEVAGFAPCTLCWYQRILMYPLTLLLAVGLLRRDHHLPVLVLPFSLLGLGFATYHYLLEKTDWFTEGTVCQGGVSCVTVWINWFGFVTIPFLSLVGFFTITLFAIIALRAGEPAPAEDASPPWLPISGIVLATLVAYVVLAQSSGGDQTTGTPFTVLEVDEPLAQSRVEGELAPDGTRLYDEACASCHGAQGEGVIGLGSALTESVLLGERSDEELLQFIRAGRAANASDNRSGLPMPPSGGRPDLTDEQMLAIIHYLRTWLAQQS